MSLASAIPMLTMAFNAETLATIKSGAADGIKTIALALKTNELRKSAVASGADTIATQANTFATDTSTLALLKYIAVKLLSNKILLAGIVILGATAYALYQVAKAYDADANAAKGTADTVEKLTDRYNELTTEAEKFKSAVSDYK